MFKDLSKEGWFELTWTEIVRHHFDDIDQLNNFDVVVFMNTSGNILNDRQKEVFQNYIRTHDG
jgi:hypothetical protein